MRAVLSPTGAARPLREPSVKDNQMYHASKHRRVFPEVCGGGVKHDLLIYSQLQQCCKKNRNTNAKERQSQIPESDSLEPVPKWNT